MPNYSTILLLYDSQTSQILESEFFRLICYTIRNQIDANTPSTSSNPDDTKVVANPFGNIALGAPQKPCSCDELQQEYHKDDAFDQFHIRLEKSLNVILRQKDSPVTIESDKQVSIDLSSSVSYHFLLSFLKMRQTITSQVREYRFIKPTYESLVDWRAHTDYLRCNPSFHNQPRYDCVLIHGAPKDYFARLLFVFTYTFEASNGQRTDIPMALIQPFIEATMHKKDIELRLLRLRAEPRKKSILIPARSIIRGAYIAAENLEGEIASLVMDVIDSDMFLRMQAMYPPSDQL